MNKRLKNAREMYADGKIDQDDYTALKQECAIKITELENRLSGTSKNDLSLDKLLNSVLGNLSRLDYLYEEGSIRQKRQIIGSIYPEKLTFEGFQYRTTRLNEAVRLIYTLDKGFSEIKIGKECDFSLLSR